MLQDIKAGSVYFIVVFSVGFLLGTIRVLVLVPKLGEMLSALIELPIILTASWIICGWVITRFSVARVWQSRLTMGVTAFGLLMLAELLLSIIIFENGIGQHFNTYLSLNGALAIAGQLVFAAFPLIQIYTSDIK